MKHQEMIMGSGWNFADQYMAKHGRYPKCEGCREEMCPNEETRKFECKKDCAECQREKDSASK